MNQSTEVLIVGAGPAGATLALALSQAKIPHILVDRAQFPRPKVDGNVYGIKVMESLNALNPEWLGELLDTSDQVLACNQAQIFTPNDRSFTINFPNAPQSQGRAPFFTVNRTYFDNFLISRLDPNYTQTFWNSKVMGLTATGRGWDVFIGEGENSQIINTKLLVAADGAESTVLQLLKLKVPASHIYETVQGYCKGVKGINSLPIGSIEGHFLTDSVPGFFFLAPMSDGTVNVGVGKPRTAMSQSPWTLTELFEKIITTHPTLRSRFEEMEWVQPLKPWPGVNRRSGYVSPVGNGYLLLGDAAGLCNPFTGFGTGNAMTSALLAAQTISKAFQAKSYKRDQLKAYDRAISKTFNTEFQISELLSRMMASPSFCNQLSQDGWIKKLIRLTFQGQMKQIRAM